MTPLHPPLQCALAPGGPPYRLATFVPEKKGAPATVRLWQYPDFGEGRFLATKTFYKASEVQLMWCAAGHASDSAGGPCHHRHVLLTARSSFRSAGRRTARRSSSNHTEVDKTGKSYYGETGFFT